MTQAKDSHPNLFTCDCGGFMFAGCGVKGGMALNETLLTCSECSNEEVMKSKRVDEVKENWE